MTEPLLGPPIDFVQLPYKRSTGQAGTLYVVPARVVAVGDVSPGNSRIALSNSPDWLVIEMDALDIVALLGGVARSTLPEQRPAELPA